MEKIQWSNDLSVGVDLIDEQHKMLIDRLNNLSEAIETRQGGMQIAKTLGFLIEYTDFHFSAEMKHMEANGYPGAESHGTKHLEFTDTLRNPRNLNGFLNLPLPGLIAENINIPHFIAQPACLVNGLTKPEIRPRYRIRTRGIAVFKRSMT